jgi:tRNA (guanine37-N1)-methyltransferase
LGDERSNVEDSFAAGLLDWPHYTRPEVFEGLTVPQVLLSGDHADIRRWRLKQAVGRTWLRRPDLIVKEELTAEVAEVLNEFLAARKVGEPVEGR